MPSKTRHPLRHLADQLPGASLKHGAFLSLEEGEEARDLGGCASRCRRRRGGAGSAPPTATAAGARLNALLLPCTLAQKREEEDAEAAAPVAAEVPRYKYFQPGADGPATLAARKAEEEAAEAAREAAAAKAAEAARAAEQLAASEAAAAAAAAAAADAAEPPNPGADAHDASSVEAQHEALPAGEPVKDEAAEEGEDDACVAASPARSSTSADTPQPGDVQAGGAGSDGPPESSCGSCTPSEGGLHLADALRRTSPHGSLLSSDTSAAASRVGAEAAAVAGGPGGRQLSARRQIAKDMGADVEGG